MNDRLYLGILSGTSMDAIDVALVSFKENPIRIKPQLIATLNYPIPERFRLHCLDIVQTGKGSIDDYGTLDAEAGELFASAALALLKQHSLSKSQIHAIGCHGQTLRHRPDASPPYTLQIGDPNIIAERTEIPTIADFRRRDIAAGGQGAPLAPGFHAAVFGSDLEDRVIVNIGGISNITILKKNEPFPLIGFDAGPGNCLMDQWSKLQWNISFDCNGIKATQGIFDPDLLNACLADPYFEKLPPKSSGREYFHLQWLREKMAQVRKGSSLELYAENIQATLLELTSQSIARAIHQHAAKTAKVFICGGGAHNIALNQKLSYHLSRKVETTEVLGLAPDWIEAVLFAWLAKQTLEGKSGNCPQVTGAKHAIPLGGIFGYRPN